jgi:hypothetical protein
MVNKQNYHGKYMKLVVILYFLAAFLQLVGQVQASPMASKSSQPKIICASYYAFKYKRDVEKLPTDKSKHCTMSCYLTRKCGGAESAIIGFLKEFADLLGFGNAEWADLRANRAGIHYGYSASSNYACRKFCTRRYPKQK